MARKFFVTVHATGRRGLIDLQRLELDLFQATARELDDGRCTIEGLLTMVEVEQLVDLGYPVLVEQESSRRSRARTAIADRVAWIRATEEAAGAGYLTVPDIDSTMLYVAGQYPSFCSVIVAPERSHENRIVRALRIGTPGEQRRGVLMLGGVHARELVNPDLLLGFTLKLCQAYSSGTGLTFGSTTYQPAVIKMIVEGLDLFVMPLVNPDGRAYVQATNGEPMWRKNRSPNPGQPCRGVDLNRNYDFLHSSGIGTSTDSCTDIFRGPSAFSEPETRNVRWMLDTYRGISGMLDVHSYSELVLYPWGDDDVQTTDPSQNFANPAWDGQRGAAGVGYAEYMPPEDLAWYLSTGQRMRDAVAAVRGRTYTLQPSFGLYPTSGTSEDYAYARRFVDTGKRKVLSYVIETAREFQPPVAEAQAVMQEVPPALVEFCLACMCVAEALLAGTAAVGRLNQLRLVGELMAAAPSGRHYVEALERHGAELLALMAADEQLRISAAAAAERLATLAPAEGSALIDTAMIEAVDDVAAAVERAASPELAQTITALRRDLTAANGKTLPDALEDLGRNPRPVADS